MGLIKLYLALSVLISHIGNFTNITFLTAEVAVSCFFVLSGFYMSLGLNKKYPTPSKNISFYLGRIIRIWPTYLISLCILMPSRMFPHYIEIISNLPWFQQALVTFTNIFVIGIDSLFHFSFENGDFRLSEFGIDKNHNGVNYVMNLPAWSLSIELIFYAIAPFVVRSFKRSIIFTLIGFTYCAFFKYIGTVLAGSYRIDSYFPYSMSFFGLGILGYWIHEKYGFQNLKFFWHSLCLALISFICLKLSFSSYLFCILLAVFSYKLFVLTSKNRVDRFLGDLAYPIYILQTPIGTVLRAENLVEAKSVNYFLVIVGASVLVNLIIERPISKMRQISGFSTSLIKLLNLKSKTNTNVNDFPTK